ncbi:hypothetical protein ACWGA9_37830 [Streptomyces sp. NPDC054950]
MGIGPYGTSSGSGAGGVGRGRVDQQDERLLGPDAPDQPYNSTLNLGDGETAT